MTRLSPLLPLLALACNDSVSQDRLDKLETDLAALRSEKEGLAGTVEELNTRLALAETNCLQSSDLAPYVTETALEKELSAYIDGSSLTAALADYATTSTTDDLDARLALVEETYVSVDELAAMDYAAQSSVDALDTRVDALEEGSSALGTRIESIEADYLVAEDIGEFVRLVDEDTTVAVDSEADLLEAWSELANLRISPEVTYTLDVAAGAFNFEEALTLNHPDGARIRVQGAGVDSTLLYFPNGDGIVVDQGSTLGYLGEMRLMGGGTEGSGLGVWDGAVVHVGDLGLESFGVDCVRVEENASLQAEGFVSASSCGRHGVAARYGGHVYLPYATSIRNGSMGFVAFLGGVLRAEGATASENLESGFYAESGVMYLHGSPATANSNGDNGYEAYIGGLINAGYANSTSNAGDGFDASVSSMISAYGSSSTGNDDDGYEASAASYVHANATTATGNADDAYSSNGNSFMYATSVHGDTTKSTSANDTDDFIYGL